MLKEIGFLTVVLIGFSLCAQVKTEAGVLEPDDYGSRRPVSYTYLREADVCWEKRVWRAIDMREKTNHNLYYPTVQTRERRSLMQLVTRLVLSGELLAFRDEEFIIPLNIAEFRKKIVYVGDSINVELYRPDGSSYFERQPGYVDSTWAYANFAELQVKEDWFFDKQKSVLEVRILSLGFSCLMRDKEDFGPVPMFYVYFPSCRPFLAAEPVFNPRNDGDELSFDDVFFKRMFSSRIIRESNVYDDRDIESYTKGIGSLLESDRIKMQIFMFEHDLWQF